MFQHNCRFSDMSMQVSTRSVSYTFLLKGGMVLLSWELVLLHPGDQCIISCITAFFKVSSNLTSTIMGCFVCLFVCCSGNSCIFAIVSAVFMSNVCYFFSIDYLQYTFCNITELNSGLRSWIFLMRRDSCALFDRNYLSRKQMCGVLYYSEFDFHGK